MYNRYKTPDSSKIPLFFQILFGRNRNVPAVLVPALLLFNCKDKGQNQSTTDQQKTAKDRMDSLHTIAMHTAKTLHDMDNPTLLKKLLEKSKEKKNRSTASQTGNW